MIDELLDYLINSSCIIKEKFHIYCPGCGGTRALKALLHLQIMESLRYNPIVIVWIIYIISRIIIYIRDRMNPDRYKNYNLRIAGSRGVLIFILVYFILRNILLYMGIDLVGDFK